MTPDRLIRVALWSAVAVNAVGAVVFLPAALGDDSILPIRPPRFYAAQIGLTIVLFGGVYAWLALQPRINRGLVVVGALGKLGFFALFVLYSAAGDVPISAVAQATPDLVLGATFLLWAWRDPV
jgi:hypothetical protein